MNFVGKRIRLTQFNASVTSVRITISEWVN